MANLQIKGTQQEIMEMLQLFDLMDNQGLCRLNNVELCPFKEQPESDLFIASIHIQSNKLDLGDTSDNDFVSQMLTGVYND